MFKKEREKERDELMQIQLRKQMKVVPYMEPVKKAKMPDTAARKHVRELAKTRQLQINEDLQARLREEKRRKGILDEEFLFHTNSEMARLFDVEEFVDERFKGLDIDEMTDQVAKALRMDTRILDGGLNKTAPDVDPAKDAYHRG